MRRATETASIITATLGTAVQTLDELCERTPGECEGMTYEDYQSRYGRAPWSDWKEPLSPGGESDLEFVARVRNVIGRLASEHRGQTTWIVCHGGVIMATAVFLMQTADGVEAPRWENPANTGISEWWLGASDRSDEAFWNLRRYNDHAHLIL